MRTKRQTRFDLCEKIFTIQFTEQGDLSRQNKRPVRVLRKSTHVSYLAARVPICLNVYIKTKTQTKTLTQIESEPGDPLEVNNPICSHNVRKIDIDFRVSGLPHAVVKEAENFRVRELVKKIESHPHRQARQAEQQQSNAHNPFSEKSKKMIRDMGNVELFELCETNPKVQCSECLLHWNQGIVYCTCGYLLKESESSQSFHQRRLDAFSIQNCVIQKERPRGARHGKTEAQNQHFLAHNARRRCLKKKLEGIHDRFQRDSTYHDSQLKIGWTEEKCIDMDKLAQENHSYCPSSENSKDIRKIVISH